MADKHHLTHATELYFGQTYDAVLFGRNARKGVQFNPITKVSLGSPVTLDADGLATGATSTELPNEAETITYLASTRGTSPLDNAATPALTTIYPTPTGVSVIPLDVPRNVTIAVTHSTSIVAMSCTVTGYDEYLQLMVETLSVTATGTSKTAAGKKAFKYIYSIAFTAAADATANTINVGWGDVLGLPYAIDNKSDVMQVWFNDVLETTAPTTVVADATTVSATTGDVRGTIDLNSAMDGSAVAVYMVTNPGTRTNLLGVTQYGG